MAEIFRRLLNLSIGATWVVGAVVLVRLLTAKAPKWIRVILWGLVALRLVFPINLQSSFSMVPVSEPIAPVELTVSPAIPQASVSLPLAEPGATLLQGPQITNRTDPVSAPEPERTVDVLGLLGWIWLCGTLLMLGYAAVSYWRLRQKLNTAVREDGIWRSEQVRSPFVLGILRPRIYLPFVMDPEQAKLVIDHEKAHIRRKDHWWKPLGFLLLSIHWFNPAMWLAYVLLCRDIEFACDEKVIRDMEPALRADYSQALLSCAVHRRQISACPLAFGESGVNGRIRSVLNYKKPAFWLILVGLVACVVVAACFLTSPREAESPLTPPLSQIHHSYTLGQAKKDGCLVMEDLKVTAGKDQWETFLQTSRNGEACAIRVVNYYALGDPSRYDPAYFESVKDQYPMLFVHDLTFDGKTYTWQGYNEGKPYRETYPYLKEFVEEARTAQATYDYCHRFVLVESANVTWDEIWQGLISPKYPSPTPKHASVYTDFAKESESPKESTPVRAWEDLAGEITLPELPGVKLRLSEDRSAILLQDSSGERVLHAAMPVINGFFKDLTGDGVPELCLTSAFGSGIVDEYVTVYDLKEETYYTMRDRMVSDYRLSLEDGKLMVTITPYATSDEADAPIKGELALIGSAYGDALHLGLWSGPLPIVNTPGEMEQRFLIKETIREKYATTGEQGHFTLNEVTILDSEDWGDPVYKDGVIDRTTVYGVFRYANYCIREGEAVCVFEKEGSLTATVRLSSTGAVYVTELEEAVPKTYQDRVEPALEELRKQFREEAQQTLTNMLSIHHPWGEDLAMKQIDFDPTQGSMEFIWDQDPAKAPIEYAREHFAYLWEDLPLCEVPENFTFLLELFLSTTYSEDTPGSPRGRWKLYRQDGTIYSRSQAESLPHADTRVIPVELPGKAGTYILEVTVYWEDFDTYMRYGMRLVVP